MVQRVLCYAIYWMASGGSYLKDQVWDSCAAELLVLVARTTRRAHRASAIEPCCATAMTWRPPEVRGDKPSHLFERPRTAHFDQGLASRLHAATSDDGIPKPETSDIVNYDVELRSIPGYATSYPHSTRKDIAEHRL